MGGGKRKRFAFCIIKTIGSTTIFKFSKIISTVFSCLLPGKLNKVGSKSKFRAILRTKVQIFEKFNRTFIQKSDWVIQQPASIFQDKTNNPTVNDFFLNSAKLTNNWTKNTENLNKSIVILSNVRALKLW